jgi:hypothetical protein
MAIDCLVLGTHGGAILFLLLLTRGSIGSSLTLFARGQEVGKSCVVVTI